VDLQHSVLDVAIFICSLCFLVTERVSKGNLIPNEADLNGVLHKHSSRKVYVSLKHVTVVQASNYIRTALFWVITQPVEVISYRRVGITYRTSLQGLTPEDGTDKLFRNVSKNLPLLAA
jgi:hypothetical protein